jgi:hypothetical protein
MVVMDVLSDADVLRADKYFAVESNNLAWRLLEAGIHGDPADTREAMNAAHASAFHWERCGEPINALRAGYLLTTIYVELGWPQAALWHARQTQAMLLALPDESTPFDRAASLAALSQAFESAEKQEEAAMFRLDAEAHAGALGPEDRALLRHVWGV